MLANRYLHFTVAVSSTALSLLCVPSLLTTSTAISDEQQQPKADIERQVAAVRTEMDQVQVAASREGTLVFEQRRKDGHSAARVAEGVVKVGAIWRNGEPIVARALDLVRPQAADPATLDVLVWILESVPRCSSADEAANLLIKHHLQSPRVTELIGDFRGAGYAWTDRLVRAQASAELPDAQRAAARMNLALHLLNRADMVDCIPDENHLSIQTLFYGPRFVDELAELRIQQGSVKLRQEGVKLLQSIAAEFPTLLAKNNRGQETTYDAWVKERLHDLKTLAIGMKALDSRGEDLDGNALALNEYRGKVVVLVFWASWCGACMTNVPEETEFVEQMRGRPFALLGVNGDDDLPAAKKAVEAAKINWRSFANGYRGKLVDEWHVAFWPTVYVIDHLGIIRAKNLNWKQVSALVVEAEAAAKQK